MNATICKTCQLALRRAIRKRPHSSTTTTTTKTVTTAATLTRPSTRPQTPLEPTTDIASLLSQPSWSVRSLLPPKSASTTITPTITPETLHHLLRLSALPPPKSPAEESQMLATLSSQLHFVRAIQSVDTTDITPLRVIRDETAQGLREQTIGLAQLRDALVLEDVVGHARRPRRRRTQQLARVLGQASTSLTIETGENLRQDTVHKTHETGEREQIPISNEEEAWDVLTGASETAGQRYFVVRSSGTGSLANGMASEES
ncbi:hypothetical protein GGS21DRAFT_157520 [Xylaria nigripes]|nr:hypothetical protein GGS21DRAFT_157520 [Xylaria nigripes]